MAPRLPLAVVPTVAAAAAVVAAATTGLAPVGAAAQAGLSGGAATAAGGWAALFGSRSVVSLDTPSRAALDTTPASPAWWLARQVGSTGDLLPTVARSQYVNAGGGGFVPFEGNVWAADDQGGVVPDESLLFGKVDATGLPALLRTTRYSRRSLVYTRTVAAASLYRLELLWAEVFYTEPGRLMDVFVSVDGGQPVALATELDIFAEVGAEAPYRLSYPPVGSEPMLVERDITLTLQPSSYETKDVYINAWSLVEEVTSTPTPTPSPSPTPNAADAKRISGLVARAKAASDNAVPAQTRHDDWAAAVAEARDAAESSVAAATTTNEGAPQTATVTAAWATVGERSAEMQSAVSAFTASTAFDARLRTVRDALQSTEDYAKSLSPPECAFVTGTSAPVTVEELTQLEQRSDGVRSAVNAMLQEYLASQERFRAVQAASEALSAAIATFQAAVSAAA